jgi:hypothetical protein
VARLVAGSSTREASGHRGCVATVTDLEVLGQEDHERTYLRRELATGRL